MKFNKPQLAVRDKMLDKLREAQNELVHAVYTLNDELVTLRNKVIDELGVYNAVLTEVQEWRDSVANDLRADWDERSEKWKVTDAGQEASSWIDDLENVDLDEIDMELPDDLETPDLTHADELAAVDIEAANV